MEEWGVGVEDRLLPGSSKPDPRVARVLLVGDQAVGKTCLAELLSSSSNAAGRGGRRGKRRPRPTIGCDVTCHQVVSNGELQREGWVEVWEVGGHTSCKDDRHIFFKEQGGINGVMLVFDLANPRSLLTLDPWLDELLSNGLELDLGELPDYRQSDHHGAGACTSRLPFVAIANKCDAPAAGLFGSETGGMMPNSSGGVKGVPRQESLLVSLLPRLPARLKGKASGGESLVVLSTSMGADPSTVRSSFDDFFARALAHREEQCSEFVEAAGEVSDRSDDDAFPNVPLPVYIPPGGGSFGDYEYTPGSLGPSLRARGWSRDSRGDSFDRGERGFKTAGGGRASGGGTAGSGSDGFGLSMGAPTPPHSSVWRDSSAGSVGGGGGSFKAFPPSPFRRASSSECFGTDDASASSSATEASLMSLSSSRLPRPGKGEKRY